MRVVLAVIHLSLTAAVIPMYCIAGENSRVSMGVVLAFAGMSLLRSAIALGEFKQPIMGIVAMSVEEIYNEMPTRRTR